MTTKFFITGSRDVHTIPGNGEVYLDDEASKGFVRATRDNLGAESTDRHRNDPDGWQEVCQPLLRHLNTNTPERDNYWRHLLTESFLHFLRYIRLAESTEQTHIGMGTSWLNIQLSRMAFISDRRETHTSTDDISTKAIYIYEQLPEPTLYLVEAITDRNEDHAGFISRMHGHLCGLIEGEDLSDALDQELRHNQHLALRAHKITGLQPQGDARRRSLSFDNFYKNQDLIGEIQ